MLLQFMLLLRVYCYVTQEEAKIADQ